MKSPEDNLELLRLAKNMDVNAKYTVVSTTESLESIIPSLCNLPISPPSLYVDIEGVNLSRDGSISIIQLHVLPLKHTFLIDVHVLGDAAFTTKSTTPLSTPSFKDILESPAIPKCFFDVRNDSDALYNLFKVSLQGIVDIQLLENATRPGQKRYLNGLARCITRDAGLSRFEALSFDRNKTAGNKLFSPEKGGSYEVFNERPMKAEILEYCLQDVTYLPDLWRIYKAKITPRWDTRVRSATNDRLMLAKRPVRMADGPHKALSPF